jgi:2-polyprenyl-3-methyl-5-hydroxy-6-metoxy-1,4-benzoquinol methylase
MACNYCKNGILSKIYSNNDLVVGKCNLCNLVQLYNFNHISLKTYTTLENLPNNFKEERSRQIVWNEDRILLLNKYFGNLKDYNVLDYGCGTGGFVELGQKYFKNIYGYDLSKKACEINKLDNIICFNHLEGNDLNYEIVTLLHVLEHIKNHDTFLKDIIETFKNTKYFIIEVPNTDEALVSIYKNNNYYKNHYSEDHLWYFTEETLKNLLINAGFKIKLSTQIQRYPFKNHLKWLSSIDDNHFEIFNELNKNYKELLIKNKIADSLFMICER